MRAWYILLAAIVHTNSSLLSFPFLQMKSGGERIEERLQTHFNRIGIEVHPQTWTAENVRRREGKERIILRKLASLDIHLSGISAIEVWRQIRKQGRVTTIRDELNYVVTFKPGITLRRIPILTSTAMLQTTGEKSLEWTGFSWGKLPLLVERLKSDKELNNRLEKCFNANMLGELRVRALDNDKVDIVSNYDSQRLPPRDLVTCIENIAAHVISYVTEQNRYRDYNDELARQKLFGPRGS